MPNGSMEKWLHLNVDEQPQQRSLNLTQRLNIAIDVASALDYLHHHSQTPIVHRDLKPSNVLLDDDMVAHVGDFGLTRFLSEAAEGFSQNQTTTSGIKGSTGYIPQEYGMGGKASTYGDVYSYGILLLEMVTGKRPTDDMFKDNQSLHHFAKSTFSEQVMEIIDPRLQLEDAEAIQDGENHYNLRIRMHDCLVSLVSVGLSCSAESPKGRMKMKDVVIEMDISFNIFISSLPPQLGNLESLQQLNISYNNFNNSLPLELGKLASLRLLRSWRRTKSLSNWFSLPKRASPSATLLASFMTC
ncbi:receptor kinase-like protein Xa21 [Magnolia sinica]|uniref:receptor kinase-like protein Xa21 n=1 Tax=Magnolia sinica TaxID=86752 RepID=UPI00265A2181|nr:receptor kinase-like protein Xa21 [Magnolia sinica]